MKINKKRLSIVLLFVCIVISLATSVYAIDFGAADKFIETGKSNAGIKDINTIGTEFTAIGNVLKYIGAGILVGATGYMGILYIISPPEKQAKLKTQLIGLVVSGFVIFGGYYIWKMIVNLLSTTMGG